MPTIQRHTQFVLHLAVQIEVLKKYVKNGGSVMFLLTEGGESRSKTNVNSFLSS